MREQECNGWTNYETWCVNLWLDNDQGTQEMVRELVENNIDEQEWHIADMLKELVEEFNPLADTATMWTDLMNSALSEVNWREIVESVKESIED